MDTGQAVDLLRESLWLMLILSFPILIAGLIAGLLVSIVQAVTQLQEQTLSFVPKIIAMGVMAIVAVPWMSMQLIEFARRMFGDH